MVRSGDVAPVLALRASQRRRFGELGTVRHVWHGEAYDLDLRALRKQLVRRQIAGELMSLVAVGKAAGVSRSTVSRLFGGCRHDLRTVRAIVVALGLELSDVARPAEEEAST